ncbi:MAG: hypothetical protein ACJ0BM_04710 [bacterium]
MKKREHFLPVKMLIHYIIIGFIQRFSIFPPKQNYAADLENAVSEFKDMVYKFHTAGLEIWLDVVFNHTAEFGADGPVDHCKALALYNWYLLEKDGIYIN